MEGWKIWNQRKWAKSNNKEGKVKFYFNSFHFIFIHFFEVLKHAVFKMNRNELIWIEMKLNRANKKK